jgi:hypothetical protein
MAPLMKYVLLGVILTWLIPATALAQDEARSPSPLWIDAGGGSGTLRGHCQECGQEFPFRHGGVLTGNVGYRVSSRLDIGADLFWIQWDNDSGRIRGTAYNAVAQFRPWESKGFFVKGGAGMAFVRNWVPSAGPDPENSKALSVMFGAGWEVAVKGRFGVQFFGTQHIGALGDLQTASGQISDVTANFWSLGAAIVLR